MTKEKQGQRRERTPDNAPHGTWNGYINYRCRCPLCKEAASLYMKRYANRK